MPHPPTDGPVFRSGLTLISGSVASIKANNTKFSAVQCTSRQQGTACSNLHTQSGIVRLDCRQTRWRLTCDDFCSHSNCSLKEKLRLTVRRLQICSCRYEVRVTLKATRPQYLTSPPFSADDRHDKNDGASCSRVVKL